MTEQIFARALEAFLICPGTGTMQHAVSILARGDIEENRIRSWCRSIARQYGVWDYIGPNFEHHIMGCGMRLAEAGED